MNSVLAFYIVHLCSFMGVLCVDSGSNCDGETVIL